MLNTTHKLVSVKRDRLRMFFKTVTVFFFFLLARLCSAWSILIFFLSKSQFGNSNESLWVMSHLVIVSDVLYT